jgi:hypothetical protein
MSKTIPKKKFPTISYGRAKTHDIRGWFSTKKHAAIVLRMSP